MSRGSLLYQVLFAIFLSNNYVHNLVWHHYHLFGSLAIEPSSGIGIGESHAFHFCFVGAGGHFDVVAWLAVIRYGVLHRGFLEVFFVANRPLGIAHGGVVA